MIKEIMTGLAVATVSLMVGIGVPTFNQTAVTVEAASNVMSMEDAAKKLLKSAYKAYDKIYVRLADSNSDTKFAQDAVTGYDFNEEYWCTDGYLLVNFNVTSYKNDTPHLTYNARDKSTEGDKAGYDPGFGDMWEIEDRAATKTDSWLQTFNFREGDFIMYDLDASMSSDYKSGGTH